MPPADNKRLAVILFADIQGYTALMQKNEEQAAVLLRRFRNEMNEKVLRHHGQIIQFYGDGALCTFQIPAGAVRCAMSLQQAFTEEPKIPVRIGIHQGVVAFEEGIIFGHAVNVTSRIESMGIEGSVLFSKTVQEELVEEYDLQMISLGSFEYKNVEGSMEVFALANKGFALPRRVDLTGKFKQQENTDEAPDKSIAVLPFQNSTGDPEQEFLGDGIAEEVIYGLSRLNQMKVAGRVSSFSFKGTGIGAYEIGKQLKVKNVLLGNVRKSGNRIRVSAELVNAQSGFQLWNERYDGSLEDFFGVQEEIAQAVVRKLELSLLTSEANLSVKNRQTANMEAYQLYLKGRQLLDRRTSFEQALTYYRQALELDPGYALAHSAMAYVYFYRILFDAQPPTLFLKAQESAHQAIQLDPRLAEAYIIEGIVYFYYYWNPEKALKQYKTAFSLNPNFDIHRILAYYHSMMGQTEEAIRLARRAVDLDPLNVGALLGLGEILYRSQHFEEAIEILDPLHEKIPRNGVIASLLGASYHYAGDQARAAAFYHDSSFDESVVLFYSLPKFMYLIEQGETERARLLLTLIENSPADKWISPASVAMVHFGLGDMEQAKACLHQGLTERDPILWIINSAPTWQSFRNHPEIQSILAERFVHR